MMNTKPVDVDKVVKDFGERHDWIGLIDIVFQLAKERDEAVGKRDYYKGEAFTWHCEWEYQKQRAEEAEDRLTKIHDIAIDYDGVSHISSLMALIDEIRCIANGEVADTDGNYEKMEQGLHATTAQEASGPAEVSPRRGIKAPDPMSEENFQELKRTVQKIKEQAKKDRKISDDLMNRRFGGE